MKTIIGIGVLLLLSVPACPGVAQGEAGRPGVAEGEAGPPAEEKPETAGMSTDQLMTLAELKAQAGQTLEAAALYEALVEREPNKKQAVSEALVRLYAQGGKADKALEWARVAMEGNPDPQVYLAGVYSMVGRWAEARRILEMELDAARDTHRKITLCWQLANACEQCGDLDRAEAILQLAADLSQGWPEELTAGKKLDLFREQYRKK